MRQMPGDVRFVHLCGEDERIERDHAERRGRRRDRGTYGGLACRAAAAERGRRKRGTRPAEDDGPIDGRAELGPLPVGDGKLERLARGLHAGVSGGPCRPEVRGGELHLLRERALVRGPRLVARDFRACDDHRVGTRGESGERGLGVCERGGGVVASRLERGERLAERRVLGLGRRVVDARLERVVGPCRSLAGELCDRDRRLGLRERRRVRPAALRELILG